jgi:hypothetical protein
LAGAVVSDPPLAVDVMLYEAEIALNTPRVAVV